MERRLATIQKITSLLPIEGADAIEKATILGWELVVKKGEFTEGQLCVYCEIDSIMPDKPEFDFLRERKFRIRTIKLRGQVSQGICFPLSILGKYPEKNIYEGADVTGHLGVIKYDPQAEAERKEAEKLIAIDRSRMGKILKRYAWYRKLMFRPKKTGFPPFIKKTDEDRIQLFPDICQKYAGVRFVATEKIDGQSGTYFLIPNPRRWIFGRKWLFGVCSRNFQLTHPDNSSYWTVAKMFDLKDKMIEYCTRNGGGLIIQGEIIGPKIQGNKYNVTDYKFFVFNVISYQNGRSVAYDTMTQEALCTTMGLIPVPYIGGFIFPATISQSVELARGISVLSSIPREGIVIRNYREKLSFKIINPDFLLKYSE